MIGCVFSSGEDFLLEHLAWAPVGSQPELPNIQSMQADRFSAFALRWSDRPHAR